MKKASKKNPLISIIVPVYKVEKYINRCIDSIINQTYKNLEIILVDDGSPDSCGKICDEYAKIDNRIKVIHKKNGGLSDARNKGIENSTGEYIGFVDSDDYIDINMYESLEKVLVETDTDIVCCKHVRFSKNIEIDKDKFDKRVTIFNQDEYMKKFFKIGTQECVYYAWNKLYKKSVIETDQYPIGLTSEDVVGTYKALLNSEKIVEINYPYYYYFYNENSITGGNFSKKDFDLIKIWDKVIEISKSQNKYVDYSILNRNRIDYTLLMRMAINLKYQNIIKDYNTEYKECLKNLKDNKKELLNSKIPLSRKITIFLICINYKFFCKIGIGKLIKRKG